MFVYGNPGIQCFSDIANIINNIKSVVNNARYTIGGSSWVQGGYATMSNYITPGEYVSATRIRNEITLTSPELISIKLYNSGYKINGAAFNSNNELIWVSGDWKTKNIIIPSVKTLRLIVAKTEDTTISPDEYINTEIEIKIGDSPKLPIKLKVMTYNIGRFSYGASPYYLNANFNEKLANYKKFFAEQQADIIGLQEYNLYLDTATDTGSYDTGKYIFDYLYPYSHNTNGGPTIKSKYPLNYFGSIRYQAGEQGCKYSVISIGNKSLFIGSTHLAANPGTEQDEIRASERAELISLMNKFDYVICCGDFNSFHTNDYNDFVNSGYKIANGGYLPYEWTCSTNPADFSEDTLPSDARYLDNIVVSSNIIIDYSEKLNVYSDLSSDHIPFVAYLTLI